LLVLALLVRLAVVVPDLADGRAFFSFSVAAGFLKGFSAAWMFPPVLQAKLENCFWALDWHLGQFTALSAWSNERLISNSVLHCGQIYSYIGISHPPVNDGDSNFDNKWW
jgi:hypothetical protein